MGMLAPDLTITRKGGKVVTIPMAPRTARPSVSAPAGRCSWPRTVGGWTGTAPVGIVRKVARRAGTGRAGALRTLRHAFITAALDAGVPLRDVQEAASHADTRTAMRYDNPRELHQTGEKRQVTC